MRAAFVALALSLLATGANAASVQFDVPFSVLSGAGDGACPVAGSDRCVAEILFGPNLSVEDMTFEVPAFDPALGTLESVDLVLEASLADFQTHYAGTTAPDVTTVGFQLTARGVFQRTDAGLIQLGVVRVASGTALATQAECAPPCSLTWSGIAVSGSETLTDDLAAFIGAGPLVFEYDGELGVNASLLGGAISGDGPDLVTASLGVTYHYTPEPGTGSLLVGGLLLGTARARRGRA